MFKHLLTAAIFVSAPCLLPAVEPRREFAEHIYELREEGRASPLTLRKGDHATTKASFSPPVEIVIEVKTDATNLRISFATNQLLVNWQGARDHPPTDGAPAEARRKALASQIPTNEYSLIRWRVTPTKQSISIDGQRRFEQAGDYYRIHQPVRVYCVTGSEVTVKAIKVRKLPPGTE